MVDMLVENSAEFSQAYPGIKMREFEQLVSQNFLPRDWGIRRPHSEIKNIYGRQIYHFSLVDRDWCRRAIR